MCDLHAASQVIERKRDTKQANFDGRSTEASKFADFVSLHLKRLLHF